MVATRGRKSGVQPSSEDKNRIIVVVTGANSGFGLGICHQLLSNLSLPPGSLMPASAPRKSALAPSQQYLLDSLSAGEETGKPTKNISKHTPPTLTLILACRSEDKAKEARTILFEKHERDLEDRRKNGIPDREGWKDGLRLVWETVDLDSVGGKTGILSLCEKLKANYPHITSLFLNAGMGAFVGLDWIEFFKSNVLRGMPVALSQPTYQIETKGAMSRDGERGLVWGTNVLAPYIMAKELLPLLRQSPPGLPFPPRIIYTSSGTASYSKLDDDPLSDYQLLDYQYSYSASKYMGDIIMCQLDKSFNTGSNESERSVRVLNADPGCVSTNFFKQGLGLWIWWAEIKFFFYWLAFYICRLLGSPWHPVYADQGALPMIYAALIPDEYLLSPDKVPAQKFAVLSTRWGKTSVSYGEVDRWEESEDVAKGLVQRCETIRSEWRRKEGLE